MIPMATWCRVIGLGLGVGVGVGEGLGLGLGSGLGLGLWLGLGLGLGLGLWLGLGLTSEGRLSSLPIFQMVMAGCLSLCSWLRSDRPTCDA